jgi:hypothetical protein
MSIEAGQLIGHVQIAYYHVHLQAFVANNAAFRSFNAGTNPADQTDPSTPLTLDDLHGVVDLRGGGLGLARQADGRAAADGPRTGGHSGIPRTEVQPVRTRQPDQARLRRGDPVGAVTPGHDDLAHLGV